MKSQQEICVFLYRVVSEKKELPFLMDKSED
jgi:hypothetical protein